MKRIDEERSARILKMLEDPKINQNAPIWDSLNDPEHEHIGEILKKEPKIKPEFDLEQAIRIANADPTKLVPGHLKKEKR